MPSPQVSWPTCRSSEDAADSSSRPRTPSPDVEKQYNLAPYGVPTEGGHYRDRFPNINEAKVIRKIDLRVVPVLCVLYLLAFLDRSVASLSAHLRRACH